MHEGCPCKSPFAPHVLQHHGTATSTHFAIAPRFLRSCICLCRSICAVVHTPGCFGFGCTEATWRHHPCLLHPIPESQEMTNGCMTPAASWPLAQEITNAHVAHALQRVPKAEGCPNSCHIQQIGCITPSAFRQSAAELLPHRRRQRRQGTKTKTRSVAEIWSLHV